ncbi:GTP-binding protein [Methylomonas sp. LL1]|uniref:CobW family GTP-binding protein n=1 Tax=Methylomonas sp. LL1 TaxID=2785785 RepID=UPI0018C3CCD7|nr:CobW family GTP-binding protein [Methylomonas sp. LL1]QPK61488.1 GTP-binding protein [Methylomonas sp. LL1]
MELAKIPVTIITGFLGSGKTTLLNLFLADGVKTAVVINEFGATPIDQDLLQAQDIPLTMLAGGCLCCQIKGALAPTLKNLWMTWNSAAVKPFERIIIETSGVASPEPILDTLLRERWLSARYRLRQVIATLAIPAAAAQLNNFAEARAQVSWADVLLLTHADLANAEQTAQVNALLQAIAPATPRLRSTEIGMLSDIAAPKFRQLPDGAGLPAHGFHSLSLYLDQTPPWPELQGILQDLLARHAAELVRIKGVVYPTDQALPIAIHAAAGHLYPPAPLPSRIADDGRSRLVFIASSGIESLAHELTDTLGSMLGKNALRLH